MPSVLGALLLRGQAQQQAGKRHAPSTQSVGPRKTKHSAKRQPAAPKPPPEKPTISAKLGVKRKFSETAAPRCPSTCTRPSLRRDKALASADATWRRFGPRWRAGPGSHVIPGQEKGGAQRRYVWLERRGGCLGCVLCNWFSSQCATKKLTPSRLVRFSTKWSRFAVHGRASMQSSTIRRHGLSDLHQKAWRCYSNPAMADNIISLPEEDQYLLRGGVPQPQDWLRLWRAVRSSTCSLRALESLSFTDSFVSCDRASPQAVSRGAYQKMAAVFADVLREQKRAKLRLASAICISLDDKSPWRDISFQASLPDGSVERGVVRVMLIGENGLDAETVADDKCRVLKNNVLEAWKCFCTPRNGSLDESLYQHILQVLVAWASDRCPAVMKAARMLRSDCPNLEFVYKDPCHVLRTVTSLVQSSFETAEAVLFENKHSVVPSVMNSHEWRNKFVWLQKVVAEHNHGQLAPALQVAVRHFNWVQPRWESSACPRRRMCHLIVPTALLLAVCAADSRTPVGDQKRLVGLLDSFRPEMFLELGFSADWGEEFIRLIRKLEPEQYDLALLHEDIMAWFDTQRALFQDLRIMEELPDQGPESQSCTWNVLRNAMECPPLFVHGRSFHLWSRARGDKATFQSVAERMSNLVEAAVARVQADLLDTPQADWQCLSLGKWHASRSMPLDEQDTFERLTRARLRRLFSMAHQNEKEGIRQYFQVVPILHESYVAKVAAGECPDNRELWKAVLQPDFARRVNTAASLSELSALVSVYLCGLSGSTGRERELARVKQLSAAHLGCGADLMSCLHEIVMDGPCQETDLVQQVAGKPGDCEKATLREGLCLAPLGSALAKLWLERHGRRFRCYRTRSDKGLKRGLRKNSEAALVTAQAAGRRQLQASGGVDKSLVGFSTDKIQVPPEQRVAKYRLSAVLSQFRRTTLLRKEESKARKTNISLHRDPYPIGKLRLGNLFQDGATECLQPVGQGRTDLPVLQLCGGLPLSRIAGTRQQDLTILRTMDAKQVVAQMRKIKLVVVNSWADLDHGASGTTTSFALACLALAVFGISATTRDNWESCASQTGLQRAVLVRKHKVPKTKVAKRSVFFDNWFGAKHARIVSFVRETQAVNGIAIVSSAKAPGPKKPKPLVITSLADAFKLVREVKTLDGPTGVSAAFFSGRILSS